MTFHKCLLASLFLLLVTVVNAQTQNIIVFGDSLSDAGPNLKSNDTGNNDWVITTNKVGAPITSVDILSSNHPLWINYVANTLLPNSSVIPYHMLKTPQDAYYYNIDYAYASAETNEHYLNDLDTEHAYPSYVDENCTHPGFVAANLACVPGILKQIDIYLTDVNKHPNPNTLFIIWAGGNDIFNNTAKLLSSFKKETVNNNIAQFLIKTVMFNPQPLTNFSNNFFSYPVYNILKAKDKLIAAGVNVNQIYILNLPDLARTPAAYALAKGKSTLLTLFHLLTKTYNESLLLALSKNIFNKNNLSANHIISIYDFFNTVLNSPAQYQLTNVTDSCVSVSGDPHCIGFVFFNEKHPTVQMEKLIADKLSPLLTSL